MAKHEHDFRDGFDVCVGNYGYYNEGELHDTWMRLPMDPDKIEPWLRSHGLFDEEHEEIYISDYDALPFRCPEVFDEYAHLDELNVLAMQLALLPDGALEHIDAAVEYGESLGYLDELGINVPEAAVVLKYPIHFYYSDASAELTGVLALPGAVAILALDGFVPKEQLAAPVIGDISRLRETVDELRRRGGLEPLPVRETIYTHTVPEGTVVANQRPAAYRATGRKKGTAMDQEKYDNEVSIKFPAKWCRVTDAQGKDIVIENGKKTETWPAVLCTIPTGTDMNGIDISGYKFKTFRKPWTESDIANGKGTTVTVKKDMPVHLFKYDENDQLKTLDADPFELSKAVKAAREAYKAKMNAEAPNPQSQAAAAVAAAHGTAELGGAVAPAATLSPAPRATPPRTPRGPAHLTAGALPCLWM